MRRRSPWALELLAYGVVGLAAGGGVAFAMGVSWSQVGLAAGALLFVLLLAVALERSGLCGSQTSTQGRTTAPTTDQRTYACGP